MYLDIDLVRMFKCVLGRDDKLCFWREQLVGTKPFCDKYPLLFDLEPEKLCSLEKKI